MGGGTTGEIQRAAKKQSTRSASSESWNKFKRDKIDKQTRAAQRNIGEASSDARKSLDMAGEGVIDWYDKNTMSLRPSSTDDDSTSSDTAEANYSTSGRTKSSSGEGKGANLKDKKKAREKGASKQLTVRKK